jgi:hypothetical protein
VDPGGDEQQRADRDQDGRPGGQRGHPDEPLERVEMSFRLETLE